MALLIAACIVATGCSKASDDDASPAASDSTTAVTVDDTADVEADLVADGVLWDDGPCDDAQPTVALGLIAPFAAGALALEDQAIAAEVSADAFNERGGIAGRCGGESC